VDDRLVFLSLLVLFFFFFLLILILHRRRRRRLRPFDPFDLRRAAVRWSRRRLRGHRAGRRDVAVQHPWG
jgi:hypothetical protein